MCVCACARVRLPNPCVISVLHQGTVRDAISILTIHACEGAPWMASLQCLRGSSGGGSSTLPPPFAGHETPARLLKTGTTQKSSGRRSAMISGRRRVALRFSEDRLAGRNGVLPCLATWVPRHRNIKTEKIEAEGLVHYEYIIFLHVESAAAAKRSPMDALAGGECIASGCT